MRVRKLTEEFQEIMAQENYTLLDREENLEEYRKELRRCHRKGNKIFANFLSEAAIPDLEKEIANRRERLISAEREFKSLCEELSQLPPLPIEKALMTTEEFWRDVDKFVEEKTKRFEAMRKGKSA